MVLLFQIGSFKGKETGLLSLVNSNAQLITDLQNSQKSTSPNPWVGKKEQVIKLTNDVSKILGENAPEILKSMIKSAKVTEDQRYMLGFIYGLLQFQGFPGYSYVKDGPDYKKGDLDINSLANGFYLSLNDVYAANGAALAAYYKNSEMQKYISSIPTKEISRTFTFKTDDEQRFKQVAAMNNLEILNVKSNKEDNTFEFKVKGNVTVPVDDDPYGTSQVNTDKVLPFSLLIRPTFISETIQLPLTLPNTDALPFNQEYASAYGNAVSKLGCIADTNKGKVIPPKSMSATGSQLTEYNNALSGLGNWFDKVINDPDGLEFMKKALRGGESTFTSFRKAIIGGNFLSTAVSLINTSTEEGKTLISALGWDKTGQEYITTLSVDILPKDKAHLVNMSLSAQLYSTILLSKSNTFTSKLYLYGMNDMSYMITDTWLNTTELGGKILMDWTPINIGKSGLSPDLKVNLGGDVGGAFNVSNKSAPKYKLSFGYNTSAEVGNFVFGAGQSFDYILKGGNTPTKYNETFFSGTFKQPKYELDASLFFHDLDKTVQPFKYGNYSVNVGASYFLDPKNTISLSVTGGDTKHASFKLMYGHNF